MVAVEGVHGGEREWLKERETGSALFLDDLSNTLISTSLTFTSSSSSSSFSSFNFFYCDYYCINLLTSFIQLRSPKNKRIEEIVETSVETIIPKQQEDNSSREPSPVILRSRPLIQTAEKRAHRRSSSMPNFPASFVPPPQEANPTSPTKQMKDPFRDQPSPGPPAEGLGLRKDRYGSLRSLTGRPRRPAMWDEKKDDADADPQDHFRSRSLTVQSSSFMKRGKRTDMRCNSTETLRPRKQSFTEGAVEFSRFAPFFSSSFLPLFSSLTISLLPSS